MNLIEQDKNGSFALTMMKRSAESIRAVLRDAQGLDCTDISMLQRALFDIVDAEEILKGTYR
jgi:hypothetical protein